MQCNTEPRHALQKQIPYTTHTPPRQVASLRAIGVAAAALTSLTPKGQRDLPADGAGWVHNNIIVVHFRKAGQLAYQLAVTKQSHTLPAVAHRFRRCTHVHATPAGGGLRLMFCTPEKVANSKRFVSKLEKL